MYICQMSEVRCDKSNIDKYSNIDKSIVISISEHLNIPQKSTLLYLIICFVGNYLCLF